MKKLSMAVAAAITAAALFPKYARADGDGGAAVALPLSVFGSLELGFLAGGTTVALGTRATARSEHPNRTWFTWSYVLGGFNLVIGGLYGTAFVDACFKADHHIAKSTNVFDNSLNAMTLGLGIAHLSVAALDFGFALTSSTKREAPRASFFPLLAHDRANRPVTGIAFEVRNF